MRHGSPSLRRSVLQRSRQLGLAGLVVSFALAMVVPGSATAASLFGADPSGPLTGRTPGAIASGDFNGDGRPDLAVANSLDNSVSIALGNGHGAFVRGPGSPVAVGNQPAAILAGDFNQDGNPDLAVVNYADNSVTVLLSDGHGDFVTAPGSPLAVGRHPTKITAGDFNGDGNIDLAVLNYDDHTISVLLGDGHGGFAAASSPTVAVGSTPIALAVADFNGDGHPDLAVADCVSNTVSVLLGDGAASFSPTPGSPYPTGEPPGSASGGFGFCGAESITASDFNHDFNPDVAVGIQGGKLSVLLGDGSGRLVPTAASPFPIESGAQNTGIAQPQSLVSGDFDGDGNVDLAVADYAQGGPGPIYDYVSVLLGGGQGDFRAAPGSPYQLTGVTTGIAAADFNRDGRLDFAASNAYGCDGQTNTIVVGLNQGMNGPDWTGGDCSRAPGATSDAGVGAPAPTCGNHEAKVGPLTVEASCFHVEGDKLVATGRIRAGGVDIALEGQGKLVIDPRAQKLSATAPVTVSLGSLKVYKGNFTWSVQGHLPLPSLPTLKIKGLPVTGSLDFAASGDGVDVIAHAAIGETKVTGDVTLHVNNQLGLQLDHLRLALGEAPIKALVLKDASLEYHRTSAGDQWTGAATVELPGDLPTLDGKVQIINGRLSEIGLEATGINKPIGAIVFLQKLGVDIHLLPHFAATGSIGLSGGPKLPFANASAISLDASLSADFGQPVVLEVKGNVRLADKVDLAQADATWTVPSKFTLSGSVNFSAGPAGVSASLSGGVTQDGFGVLGNGQVSVPESTRRASPTSPSRGSLRARASRQGQPASTVALDTAGEAASSCGRGLRHVELQVARPLRARGAAAIPVTFSVPRGQRQTLFGARGVSDYPRFSLRSPTGQVIDATRGVQGAIDRGGYRWVTDPTLHATYVFVARPTAGTWTLLPAADSPTIASAGSVLSAPTASVRATVRDQNGRKVLSWRAPPVVGQTLRFVELGSGVRRTILTTRAARGSARFSAADDGRGETRRILVLVSQDGLPRAQLQGPQFRVPRPPSPGRSHGLRVRLHRGSATVTWGPARRTADYQVFVRLSDGRRLFFSRGPRARRVIIRRVLTPATVTVTILAIAADQLHGSPARVTAHFRPPRARVCSRRPRAAASQPAVRAPPTRRSSASRSFECIAPISSRSGWHPGGDDLDRPFDLTSPARRASSTPTSSATSGVSASRYRSVS